MADPTPEERAKKLRPCPCDDPDEHGRSYRDQDGLCGLCRHERTKLGRAIRDAEAAAFKRGLVEADRICEEIRTQGLKLKHATGDDAVAWLARVRTASEIQEKIRARAKEAPRGS